MNPAKNKYIDNSRLSNPKILVLLKTSELNNIRAIGEINKVSKNNPKSDEMFIFFLINVYKLKVIATINPIQGIFLNPISR